MRIGSWAGRSRWRARGLKWWRRCSMARGYRSDADHAEALLKERFRLEAHTEGRPVAGYALAARRPKLRKADPSNRPGCREGAQFARQLHETGYFPPMRPIFDSTGLRAVVTCRSTAVRRASCRARTARRHQASRRFSDPTGVISLKLAVEKLGLRLQSRTLPGEVLVVIDQVDEMPSENRLLAENGRRASECPVSFGHR